MPDPVPSDTPPMDDPPAPTEDILRPVAPPSGHARTSGTFSWAVPVRFRDVDAGGHVHHSHVLAYMEEARLAWWAAVTNRPMGLATVDHILAEIQVRYRARIHWPDRLRVDVRVAVAGRVHLELEQQVWREPAVEAMEAAETAEAVEAAETAEAGEGARPAGDPPTPELVAEGRVVLLPYDYGRSASVPVPDSLRARLEADAGHPLPRRRPRS